MTTPDGDWRLVREEARDGATNMALDEVAAASASEDRTRTLRVYRWDPSTLSLGYRQAADTVDWAFCDREGVDVTRRQTGGGGIYHDVYGDISYSIVAPADELPGDLMACYDLLCTPILEFFDRLGVDAAFADREYPSIHEPACYLRGIHPAHDILVDGRKVSGNAQYRQRDAVIQHGSITFDRATERHLGVFADPDTTPDTFDDRVTCITDHADVTRAEAVETLETALAEWAGVDPDADDAWTDDELAAARDRADRKYRSDAWVRERTDPLD